MISSYLIHDLWTVKAPVPPSNEYNEPNAPIVVAIKGFIEWKSTLVRNTEGEEVTSQASVLVKYDSDLGHNDMLRITDLSSGNNIDWPIITIKPNQGYYVAGMYVFL